jgi:hypothetical protein
MTRLIWTKVFVASLVFLGDWAFAAENNLRAEIDAAANDITVQISKQILLTDSETKSQPMLLGTDAKPQLYLYSNLIVTSSAPTLTDELKYHPSNPRAPPLPAS